MIVSRNGETATCDDSAVWLVEAMLPQWKSATLADIVSFAEQDTKDYRKEIAESTANYHIIAATDVGRERRWVTWAGLHVPTVAQYWAEALSPEEARAAAAMDGVYHLVPTDEEPD